MENVYREGYVEAAIELENEKFWNAYLSINVKQKTGEEKIPVNLPAYLENTSQYWGLSDFFEENVDKEVWLTDNVISLEEERDIYSVWHAILGKDILVHLCVDSNRITEINDLLYKITKEEVDVGVAFIRWKYSNDGYVIQLMKRLSRVTECIVRLYEDGNGVIVNFNENDYDITYFILENAVKGQIISAASAQIDEIVNKPTWVGEDDRYWGYDVHLKYNLEWKYPEVNNKLKDYQRYEDTEYSDDETKIKIAKQLLSVAEIKKLWIAHQ